MKEILSANCQGTEWEWQIGSHSHSDTHKTFWFLCCFGIFLNRVIQRAATKSEKLECKKYHIFIFLEKSLFILL